MNLTSLLIGFASGTFTTLFTAWLVFRSLLIANSNKIVARDEKAAALLEERNDLTIETQKILSVKLDSLIQAVKQK